jgi:hypothetical protein
LEVERFARRLRTHLDLDELTGDLLGVVAKTVQPSTASIWIRVMVDDRHDGRTA